MSVVVLGSSEPVMIHIFCGSAENYSIGNMSHFENDLFVKSFLKIN